MFSCKSFRQLQYLSLNASGNSRYLKFAVILQYTTNRLSYLLPSTKCNPLAVRLWLIQSDSRALQHYKSQYFFFPACWKQHFTRRPILSVPHFWSRAVYFNTYFYECWFLKVVGYRAFNFSFSLLSKLKRWPIKSLPIKEKAVFNKTVTDGNSICSYWAQDLLTCKAQ